MNENQDNVVFHEGEMKIAQKIRSAPEETQTVDRSVKLVMKFSGGLIKSKKAATFVVLALIGVMIVVSIIWWVQALQ